MTISDNYFKYILHFKQTVPVICLFENVNRQSMCALRHDVDYDLDLALEMAYWEHEKGFQSTYYILHTADYWQDPLLIDKCLQLQDFGHEVGLHLNFLAQWANQDIDNIKTSLSNILKKLRDGGVDIRGVSAHGDPLCYKYNVNNYWCFRELKPINIRDEYNRTAEGNFAQAGDKKLIYPSSNVLTRKDGKKFKLWSLSLSSFGIDYHAWHLNFDRYFSDSGGSWKRTDDPLECRRADERWQVLMHPIYWRGKPKYYFFLSTARSGSKWLTEVLKQATSVKARHEYILNQDYYHGESVHKATAYFRRLEHNHLEVFDLFLEAWQVFLKQEKDCAEINVYLVHFIENLKKFFPHAVFIHLYRDPSKVVRSLMNRNWYDTPEDYAHAQLTQIDAAQLNQFERICYYVAETNLKLKKNCDFKICLEDVTKSGEKLATALSEIGVVYYPRLAGELLNKKIDPSVENNFPVFSKWNKYQKKTFHNIFCDSSMFTISKSFTELLSKDFKEYILSIIKKNTCNYIKNLRNACDLKKSKIKICESDFFLLNCEYISVNNHAVIRKKDITRNSYLTLKGCTWYKCRKNRGMMSGWKVKTIQYIRGKINIEIADMGYLVIFAIHYNITGERIYIKQLGTLDKKQSDLEFAFSMHKDASVFDIGLYIPTFQQSRIQISIFDFRLERLPLIKQKIW